jgi:hypothetical protein
MAEVTKEFARRYLLQFLEEKDVTPEVVDTFLEFLKSSGIKPVYIVPMKTKALVRFYVTLEGLLDRAYATKEVELLKSGIVVLKDGELIEREGTLYFPESGEKLVGGWAEVKRKSMLAPVKTVVGIREYERSSNAWKSLPATMIEKVALSKALRRTFPELGSGYIPEESSVITEDRIQQSEEAEEIEFYTDTSPLQEKEDDKEKTGSDFEKDSDIDRKLLEKKVKALGLKLIGKENFITYLKTKYGKPVSELSTEQLQELLKNLENMGEEQEQKQGNSS